MNPSTEPEWLSLSEAASFLGVNPLTLRSWARQGKVLAYRTPGGHRRFRPADLSGLLRPEMPLARLTARHPLAAAVHQHLEQHTSALSAVRGQLSEEAIATARGLGSRLMGLLIRYLGEDGAEDVLEQSQRLGAAYGQYAAQQALSLSQTVESFNAVRDVVVEATFSQPAHHLSPQVQNARLYHRLNRFFNDVLLAIVRAFEACFVPESSSATALPDPQSK